MKSKVCFLTLFISIMSTVTAFAFCDVELLIFPPNDDGGEKIIYYRVEYMNIEPVSYTHLTEIKSSNFYYLCGSLRELKKD